MKKIALLICLFSAVNYSFAQNSESDNITEKLETNTNDSKFSLGFSPFVYIGINDYNTGESGPGFGFEIMGLYGVHKNFNLGSFAKLKGNYPGGDIPFPGEGYNEGGQVVVDGAASFGAILEYKVFNKVGFNFRLGYEKILTEQKVQYDGFYSSNGQYIPIYREVDNSPGLIYGGGISLYISRKEPRKAIHSFNWGVMFEQNNTTSVDMINFKTNRYEQSVAKAFYVHFGWRIMFRNLLGSQNKKP